MQIFINGSPESLAEPLSVTALLEQRALSGKRVAIERNGEIVPKSRHASTFVQDGDQLEIVIAVGGG